MSTGAPGYGRSLVLSCQKEAGPGGQGRCRTGPAAGTALPLAPLGGSQERHGGRTSCCQMGMSSKGESHYFKGRGSGTECRPTGDAVHPLWCPPGVTHPPVQQRSVQDDSPTVRQLCNCGQPSAPRQASVLCCKMKHMDTRHSDRKGLGTKGQLPSQPGLLSWAHHCHCPGWGPSVGPVIPRVQTAARTAHTNGRNSADRRDPEPVGATPAARGLPCSGSGASCSLLLGDCQPHPAQCLAP